MFSAWKDLIGSKKFWYAIIGSAVVTAMTMFGLPYDIIMVVAGFFGVSAMGQGLADIGKEKAKVETSE